MPTTATAIRPPTATNRPLILVIMALAQFVVVLDLTIVNVALPSIQQGLHFAPADLQWVVNAYSLTFGGFLLLGGRAADLLGRRRIFVVGMLLFAGASVLNGLATSPGVLIAGRALQGMGGALLSPAALSIITTTFTEESERTKALSVWGAISASGGAVGLLLGGVLTETLSWQWVFLAPAPVAAIASVTALRVVPESRGRAQSGFDVGGAVSVTGGLVLIVYATVQAQKSGWTAASTLGLFALGVALIVAFVLIERRHPAPLMRLGILRVRTVAVSNLAMLFAGSGLISMFFFASIYAQDVLGYGPMRAGFAFVPMALTIMAAAATSQRLLTKLSARLVPAIGIAIASLGMVAMLRLSTDSSYLDLLLGIVLVAFGMGMSFIPLTLLATSGVAGDDAGLASGLFNTAQQVGGALGLAALSTLAASRTADLLANGHVGALEAQVRGFHVAFLTAIGLFVVAVALLLVFLRDRHLVVAAAVSPADTVPEPRTESSTEPPAESRTAPGTGTRPEAASTTFQI